MSARIWDLQIKNDSSIKDSEAVNSNGKLNRLPQYEIFSPNAIYNIDNNAVKNNTKQKTAGLIMNFSLFLNVFPKNIPKM